ncbi:hypothetical protein WJX81_002778 [Elliptochloris bilobata]|uniref:ER membrane protein complex subunit 10 n=1 Tax=Elliptochloris bilobata TaxID=381761 RepID=A0AAW1RCR3_9CHLO
MRGAALVALLALLPAVLAQHISLQLEHSLDGARFTPAGRISGNLEIDEDGSLAALALQRDALSTAEEEAFAQLVKGDGMYLLRASAGAPPAATLLTALPARCLTTPGFQELLQLDASPAGRPLALSYAAGCCSMARPGPRAWAPARTAPVAVRLPAAAPAIAIPAKPIEQGAPAAPEPPKRQPAAKEGAKAGEVEEKLPPPPDTRTWLQKNWIFAVPVVMIIFNMLSAGPGGKM